MAKTIYRRSPPPPEPVAISPRSKWLKTVDLGLWRTRGPVVLGIDASPRGHAIFALNPEDYKAWGWTLALPEPSRGGPDGIKRLLVLQAHIEQVLVNIKMQSSEVLHVVMEQYAFSRGAGYAHAVGEVGGLTKLLLCKTFGADNIVSYPTMPMGNQLKLFATSKGNVDKNVVLKEVYRKWGVDLNDDNLADAYTAARWAACIVTGQTAHEYEAAIVAKVREHTEWDHQEPPQKRPSVSSRRAKRAS